MNDILEILPLTVVMIAGPQIISAVFFATSERWAPNSVAYLIGGAISVTAFVTIAYFIAKGANDATGKSSQSSTNDGIQIVILGLLVAAAAYTFAKRKVSEPPKWMGRLQTATPRFAFVLGLLLLGVFPTDIASSVSAGGHLARNGAPWVDSLAFVGLTVLLLATPSLLVLLLGHRAKELLPRLRDWMNANSWVINEAVLAFFFVLTLNKLVS
jgi:Sap, sulfolipid-1-addressing protein